MTSVDRALMLGYKTQRKLRRELRRRFTPALVKSDLRAMNRSLGDAEPKSLLLDYAALAGPAWPQDVESWLSAEEAQAVVLKADEVRACRFDLLGSGLVDAGNPIDWHRDLKTGFRWPEREHHLNIAWDAVPAGTDIKMPWELSRCQHFVTLALADRVSGEAKYYETFKLQLSHWIDANPCGFGVNWVCAMDVAIRAVNGLTAGALFRHRLAEEQDMDFLSKWLEAMWLHGCHIMRNLEWQGPQTPSLANHFLADLCGLLAVGALFRETAEGKQWIQFAHRWFEREIERQVFADGSLYETSTSYHRLSHEMFLWADTMAGFLGMPFGKVYQDRLEAMASFVSAYMSPSGHAAQFGDNDGGRFLTVGVEAPHDHRYLTAESHGFGGRANQLLLSGGRALPPTPQRRGFPDGGYWFGQVDDAWIGVRAGEVSHNGAHAHADQLSFVLAVGGRDVIVDPGTGVYSADVEKRNAYRSSTAHNSPRLNGWESNRFPEGMGGLFRMSDDTRTEVTRWEITDGQLEFEGRHRGFETERADAFCGRSLELKPGRLELCDRVENLKEGDLMEWSFRLAPEVMVEIVDGVVVLQAGDRCLRLSSEPTLESEVADATISPSYGEEEPSKVLHLKRRIEGAGKDEQRIEIRWIET